MFRFPRIAIISQHGRLMAAGIVAYAIGALTVSATPYRPTDDSTILLETPPSRVAIERAVRGHRNGLATRPDVLPAALEIARLAIRDGRENSDPRRYGQAEAALAPWWAMEDAPTEVRLSRAVVRQALHDFSGAIADLDAILERDPGHAQARLSRAFVRQATGALASAADDCRNLPASIGRLAVAACIARVEASTGRGAAALDHLGRAIAVERHAAPDLRRWACDIAAETAASLGREDEASHWFALATEGGGDIPTLVAYADFLLDLGRAPDVIPLLVDRPAGDVVLLRLAIAAKAVGDPRLVTWSARLADGFALAAASGNAVHLREEARFTLEILGEPRKALDLARRNWSVQKEPADARLVLDAALAAEKAEAAGDVLAFIRATGLDDVRLKPLLDELRARKGAGAAM